MPTRSDSATIHVTRPGWTWLPRMVAACIALGLLLASTFAIIERPLS